MLKAAKIRRCSFRLTTIQLLGPEDLIKMLNAATYTDSSLSLMPILSMSHKRWTLSFKSNYQCPQIGCSANKGSDVWLLVFSVSAGGHISQALRMSQSLF